MMAAAVLAACSWAAPGANAYTGPVPAAVDRYTDIPLAVRERLKARMQRRDFDELATIRRDSIEGQHSYTNLRDMHFGAGTVCRSVDRSAWAADAVERGLVYCEADHCIIVPTVCRNVSRVTRTVREPAPAAGLGMLAFDAPGAGAGGATGLQIEPLPPVDLSRALGLAEPLPAPIAVAATLPHALPPLRAEPLPQWWAPPAAPQIQPWAGALVEVPPIPEPGTLLLAALGVAALLWRVRPNDRANRPDTAAQE